MILLDDEKTWGIYQANGGRGIPPREQVNSVAKAQAKKILIQLQSIYKLPDLKMEHDRMGGFIQELLEEVE